MHVNELIVRFILFYFYQIQNVSDVWRNARQVPSKRLVPGPSVCEKNSFEIYWNMHFSNITV